MTSDKYIRGAGLPEVLISLVMVSVAALAMVSMHTYFTHQLDFARHSQQALYCAESRLEWFRTAGVAGGIDFTAIADDTETCHGDYTLEWTVTGGTGNSAGDLHKVTIESRWTDSQNQPQSITLETMISKYSKF